MKRIKLTKKQYDGLSLYFRNVRRITLLSKEEEKKLVEKIKKGSKEARRELSKHNLPLVMNIAEKYMHRGVPVSFRDMIEAGNEGLVIASQKFNPLKGNRFSTYATLWIKGSIRELFRNTSSIKISEYYSKLMVKYKNAKKELTQLSNGEEPTVGEIAKKMRVNLNTASKIEGYLKLNATTSMNHVTGIEKYANPNADTIQKLEDKEPTVSDRIKSVFYMLTKRERQILRLRFGIDDGRPWRLKETAKKFGVTKEKIHEIEKELMRKLASPEITKKMQDFIPADSIK